MKRLAFAAAATIATPAAPEIQGHDIQTLFTAQPCTAVIETIDSPPPTPEGIGFMAMAFGVILGFELENPNAASPDQTLLIRLRRECANQPEKSALQIMRDK